MNSRDLTQQQIRALQQQQMQIQQLRQVIMQQLQQNIDKLVAERQGYETYLFNILAQENAAKLAALNHQELELEAKLLEAKDEYRKAKEEYEAAKNLSNTMRIGSFIDKITGNAQKHVANLHSTASLRMEGVNQLEEAKFKNEELIRKLTQGEKDEITFIDNWEPLIAQAQAELQQLKTQAALEQIQIENQMLENNVAALQFEQNQLIAAQSHYQPVQPGTILPPAQVFESADLQMAPEVLSQEGQEIEQVQEAEYMVNAQVETNVEECEEENSFEEINGLHLEEHVKAAKQKVRDSFGEDCDIPDDCDLETLTQLAEDRYKYEHETSRSKPASIKEVNPAQYQLGFAIMILEVKTTTSLAIALHGNQLMIEMVEKVSVRMTQITQDKNGDVSVSAFQAKRTFTPFDSQSFFGREVFNSGVREDRDFSNVIPKAAR